MRWLLLCLLLAGCSPRPKTVFTSDELPPIEDPYAPAPAPAESQAPPFVVPEPSRTWEV